MKHIVFILVCCLVSGVMVSGQEQQAKKLLSEAIYQEEINGDLNKAIKTYQQILSQFPNDRKVSAEVLLHLGLCHEKLGNQEAAKTYNRLVNNYPDQKSEVAIAKERLSRLVQISEKVKVTSPVPQFTKINFPTRLSPYVRLSPDGQTLAYTADKKLWTIPLSGNAGPNIAGRPVQLNTEGVDEVDFSGLSWSGDGRWIAFNGMPSGIQSEKVLKGYECIFVLPSAGGNPKKVVENYRELWLVNYRISLSPDGKQIAYTSVENDQQHIFIKQIDSEVSAKLVEKEAREPVFSPDGKWIAYVDDKNLGGQGGNLWIVPVTGGVPVLVARATNATNPIWSPDVKIIAFIDNADKNSVKFAKIPKEGESPEDYINIDVPEETGSIRLLAGWTADNLIGIHILTNLEPSLYTLPATGGQPTIVMHKSQAYQPRWSPDGKQIYYVTNLKDQKRFALASVSSSGGNGRPVPNDTNIPVIRQHAYQSGNRLSPDGKMIISSAYTSADTIIYGDFRNCKIWKMSLDGSESKQITTHQGIYSDLSPSWSPDGRKIAFIRARLIPDDANGFDKMSIYITGSDGREPFMLIPEAKNNDSSPVWLFSPVWSPDGKMIAYFSKDNKTSYLNIIDPENGSSLLVKEVPPVFVNTELTWAPDSKQIAFNDNRSNLIKVLSLSDGSIKDIKTNLADVKIYHLDWSPDGRQFVFGGNKGGGYEFYLLGNFLPLEKKK